MRALEDTPLCLAALPLKRKETPAQAAERERLAEVLAQAARDYCRAPEPSIGLFLELDDAVDEWERSLPEEEREK